MDRENRNSLWAYDIAKENIKDQVVLKLLKQREKSTYEYKGITVHWVFDLNMDLTRKSIFLARGSLTEPPQDITYSSVVSRDSVQILLTIFTLNYLGIQFLTFIMHT